MRLHPLTHPESRSFLFCLNKTSVKSRLSSASNSAVAPILLRVKAKVWTTAHGPVASGPHLVLPELLSHSFPTSLSQPVTWPSSLVLTRPARHTLSSSGLALADGTAWGTHWVDTVLSSLLTSLLLQIRPTLSPVLSSAAVPLPFPASTFSFLSRTQSLNG